MNVSFRSINTTVLYDNFQPASEWGTPSCVSPSPSSHFANLYHTFSTKNKDKNVDVDEDDDDDDITILDYFGDNEDSNQDINDDNHKKKQFCVHGCRRCMEIPPKHMRYQSSINRSSYSEKLSLSFSSTFSSMSSWSMRQVEPRRGNLVSKSFRKLNQYCLAFNNSKRTLSTEKNERIIRSESRRRLFTPSSIRFDIEASKDFLECDVSSIGEDDDAANLPMYTTNPARFRAVVATHKVLAWTRTAQAVTTQSPSNNEVPARIFYYDDVALISNNVSDYNVSILGRNDNAANFLPSCFVTNPERFPAVTAPQNAVASSITLLAQPRTLMRGSFEGGTITVLSGEKNEEGAKKCEKGQLEKEKLQLQMQRHAVPVKVVSSIPESDISDLLDREVHRRNYFSKKVNGEKDWESSWTF